MSQTKLQPLNEVDPAEAWARWEPDSRQPWSLKWAGHLYRRAGFGASQAELRQAVQKGLPETLERLLQGAANADEHDRSFLSAGEQMARQGDPPALRGWWLYCMLHTQHPLREKLTLFWHNHFATSIAKVQQPVLMYKQNSLLRQNALGKFRPLLLEMSRDPAMLVWLDSNENVKGKPNENYARELMELFGLGVGNYTEKDIREAARAFTGWHTNADGYEFNSAFHDDGVKTVLGQKGNWNGDDVVRIVLDQPAAARFIAGKLYRFVVSETVEPPARLLEPLAEALRQSDFDLALVIRLILSSRHFYSAYAYRQRIKSPVEFVVGALRALAQKPVPPNALLEPLEQMGQSLFAPPNVKGWEGGRSWLNTSTVLARHNFAENVMTTYAAIDNRLEKEVGPGRVVGEIVDLLLQGDVNEPLRKKLENHLAEGKPQGKALAERIREVGHAIMTTPEYELA
jgi:uncharacterized protein (DUF1800 family)